MAATHAQRLADALLGDEGPLERFVRSRRAEGVSWRMIARELYERTDVDVVHETLRLWYPDPAKDKAAS